LIEPGALEPPRPQRYPLLKGQAALQSPADGGVLGKLYSSPNQPPISRAGPASSTNWPRHPAAP